MVYSSFSEAIANKMYFMSRPVVCAFALGIFLMFCTCICFEYLGTIPRKFQIKPPKPSTTTQRLFAEKEQNPMSYNSGRMIDSQEESTPHKAFLESDKAAEATRTSVPVLILAYTRTGSTFTGELVRQSNESFYRYEPLNALENMIKTKTIPSYFNGTTRAPYTNTDMKSRKVEMVRPFLSCDFSSIPVQLITDGFGERTRHAKDVFRCVHRNGSNCMAKYTESCRNAPARIVKVIRLRMRDVPELLQDIPGLKVIHLLRDPRGQLNSVQNSFGYGVPTSTPAEICIDVGGDIIDRVNLEKTFPKTFLEVIYEDLAQQPMETAHKIYKFLGLKFSENVTKWIETSTNGYEDKNFLGTTKRNSTLTAYKWTQIIPWRYVQYFEENCPELLRWGHFPVFQTEAEVRNFTIPIRSRLVH